MAIAGRKPKDDDRKVNPNPPTHEWVEVEDVPFLGDRPKARPEWPQDTKRWWTAVSTMAHCIRWTATEWESALVAGRLHAAVVNGDLGRAAELRIREKAMGTTAEALRDLRIRYVSTKKDVEPTEPKGMANFDEERRRRLLNAE